MKRLAGYLLAAGCVALSVSPIYTPDGILPIAAGVILSTPYIIKDIKARGCGPRWIWAAFALIILPTFAHMLYNPTADNAAGFIIFALMVPVYLAARAHGPRLLVVFPVAALVESIALLIIRTQHPSASAGGLMGIAHFSSFIIMIGLFTARGRIKMPLYLLGPPAILVTGSEEGLLFLGAGALALIYARDRSRYTAAAAVAIVIALAVIIPTGHFADTHQKLNMSRFESIGAATDHRSTGVSDNISTDWITGDGWHWDTAGGRHQTVHNAFLKMAAQYGALACAGFFIILMVPALFYGRASNYGLFLTLGAAAMVDHFLMTSFFPLPNFIAGAIVTGPFMDAKIKNYAFSIGLDF